MEKRRILIALTFSISLLGGFAQSKYLKEADQIFANEGYFDAVGQYQQAFARETKPAIKAEILYKIGECYRLVTNAEQAKVWYEKAIKARYNDPEVFLHYGDVLKQLQNYEEALVQYEKFIDKKPSDPRGTEGAQSCKTALNWIDTPKRWEVRPEILLNSKYYDYSPAYVDKRGDKIIFTSSRPSSSGDNIDPRSGEGYMDLYIATRDKNGKWSEPQLLGENVNSPTNEGAASLNTKKSVLFYTKCPNDKDKSVGCEIWMAKKQGNSWSKGVKVEGLKSDDSTSIGHPALTDKDLTMIFASNMAGGMGGRDLYITKFDKKAKMWSEPVNLGSPINTEGDEMFPFIHSNGALYFSSDGHPGMGGLDIFVAEKVGPDKWGNVMNMESPINSGKHDHGIVFDEEKEKGFFVSSRSGKNKDDIYSFNMPPLFFKLQGQVFDFAESTPVAGAKVKVNGSDGSSFGAVTDANGGYVFDEKGNGERFIDQDVTYSILVEATDYLVAKDQITTIGMDESVIFIKDFAIKYTKNVEIKFPDVLYKLSEWGLDHESNPKDSLDFLYQTLVDNPTIIIELSAHTDSRGGADYNRNLSQKRAESCVNYLISKGIDAARMIPKGYGRDRLLISDADINVLSTEEEKEAAHQKNRRTVFSVISWDYVPKLEGGESDSGDSSDDAGTGSEEENQ